MCGSATESTTHVLCACPKIAQSLYKARHDRSLRPIYHHLLEKYNFQESDNEKPWYQQRPPSAVMENENAKILLDVPFQLQKAPENGAKKKKKKEWQYTTNRPIIEHYLKALSAKLAQLRTKQLRNAKFQFQFIFCHYFYTSLQDKYKLKYKR